MVFYRNRADIRRGIRRPNGGDTVLDNCTCSADLSQTRCGRSVHYAAFAMFSEEY